MVKALEPPKKEIVIWDEMNSRSLVNMLPEHISREARNVYFEHPEYFGLSERELAKVIREKKDLRPCATVNRIRLKMWEEYDRAQMTNTDMDLVRVYGAICAKETFASLMKVAYNIAWILCPPTDYLVMMEESLLFGIEQIRDILDLEIVAHGQVNARLAELKVKIVMMLDERVKGAVTKHLRIDQNTQSLNITATNNQVQALVEQHSEEELQKILEKIKKREIKKEKLATIDAEIVNE